MEIVAHTETLKKEVIMPRGDKTGPEGMGSMTGRQLGFCTGNETPGFTNQGFGFGRGSGRGFGLGRRPRGGFRTGFRRYYQQDIPNVSEKTLLENEIKVLKEQLSNIENQLSQLNKES